MTLTGDNLKRDSAQGSATGGAQMVSALGHTRNGEPLSNNRAPAEDLSPWIARVYATSVEVDTDDMIECGLIADTPVLRVLFGGEWTAETRDGLGHYRRSALLFGPQTRRMPVSVRGSFGTVGIALKPGAMEVLGGPDVDTTLDRILHYDEVETIQDIGSEAELMKRFDTSAPPAEWLKVAEECFRGLLALNSSKRPKPIIEQFDKAVFADPNLSIGEFVREHGIERRSFERRIKRAYGQSATQVLRRARALDIAAHLRGVADDEEAAEAALRFFDQSHMIREFKAFFGMTPRAFARTPQPFMTLTLEARQARRMEVLGRVLPDQPPPWRTQG